MTSRKYLPFFRFVLKIPVSQRTGLSSKINKVSPSETRTHSRFLSELNGGDAVFRSALPVETGIGKSVFPGNRFVPVEGWSVTNSGYKHSACTQSLWHKHLLESGGVTAEWRTSCPFWCPIISHHHTRKGRRSAVSETWCDKRLSLCSGDVVNMKFVLRVLSW